MWSKQTARTLILEREQPKDPYVRKMLLAHERYWGRTEETGINKTRELQKLHGLIENMKSPMPPPRVYEHPGMRELRSYVAQYQLALEKRGEKTANNEREEPREPERERGR